MQAGVEQCDDGNEVNNDQCANDCTFTLCLKNWPCDPIHGPCLNSEPGYHWKGLFTQNNVQYACWWHTKNQGWNTTTATNFWHLADHFQLGKNLGTSRWCFEFASDPCRAGACAPGPNPVNYFQENAAASPEGPALPPGAKFFRSALNERMCAPQEPLLLFGTASPRWQQPIPALGCAEHRNRPVTAS